MVAVGFVRIVTNPHVTPAVTATPEAFGFLRFILRARGVAMTDLGPEWGLFETLCLGRGLRGKIVSDAWIAAAVKANGLHLVTFDSDFRELLHPGQYTGLESGPNLQEPQPRYLVRRRPAGFDNLALAA